MTVSTIDIIHIIIALTIVLFVCHSLGYLFEYFKQPRVIGEILAGIVLGPSLFQYFCPNAYSFVFNDTITKTLLNIFYQLGLLHLMFRTGMELQLKFKKQDRIGKAATWITVVGVVIPFASSLLFVQFVDIHKYMGAANNEPAFIMCFSIAVAITGIPIIARILYDLKILTTSFAKIILATAVIEDILLFIILTVALGLVRKESDGGFGIPALLGLESNIKLKILYHTLATILFFVISIWIGFRFFRWLDNIKFTIYQKISPLGFLISVMLFMTAVALLLDLAPMFGAFVGGIIAQNFKVEKEETGKVFETYSFAFFIPIYFAMVGIKLSFIPTFNFLFFLLFLLVCCVVKFLGVYLGARLAKESKWGALNFGMALNARGAPAIVVASLALDNQIINISFFTILVVLAIVTSFIAGSWLNFVMRNKLPLR